jgi:hypothetical protein
MRKTIFDLLNNEFNVEVENIWALFTEDILILPDESTTLSETKG